MSMDPFTAQKLVEDLRLDVWMASREAWSALNYEAYISNAQDPLELEQLDDQLQEIYKEAEKLDKLHELLVWYKGWMPKPANESDSMFPALIQP